LLTREPNEEPAEGERRLGSSSRNRLFLPALEGAARGAAAGSVGRRKGGGKRFKVSISNIRGLA